MLLFDAEEALADVPDELLVRRALKLLALDKALVNVLVARVVGLAPSVRREEETYRNAVELFVFLNTTENL